MKKAQKPWKRKKNRISDRAAKGDALSLMERAQMEENCKKFARCWFLGVGFRIKRVSSFQVLLKHKLSTEEIEARIDMAFKDVV